jgi:transposase
MASPAGTPAALLARIGRYRRQAEERLRQPVRVLSCYEAGYDGFWLHWPFRQAAPGQRD